jgi:hypothetical protein
VKKKQVQGHKKGAKTTYKDIEVIETNSIAKLPSANHLGSLTATVKNMRKKNYEMGRKKSTHQPQLEAFKGSF